MDDSGDLNDIVGVNTDGVAQVVSFVKTIAGFAGPAGSAVSTVFSLVSAFINAGKPDAVMEALQHIEDTINAVFQQLEMMAAAQVLIDRNTTLNGYFAPALHALLNVENAKNEPAIYPPADLIQDASKALLDLSSKNDIVWNVVYNVPKIEKIYWSDVGLYQTGCYYVSHPPNPASYSDAGYGLQDPPQNKDLSVFDYRNSLPLYLWTLAIYLAVGGSLDPNFFSDNIATFRVARDVLQGIHDRILEDGVKVLSPPDWTGHGLLYCGCPSTSDGTPLIPPAGLQLVYAVGAGYVVGATIEYGAVERFSGCSSVGSNYKISNVTGESFDQDPAVYNKVQIRALKRVWDVYAAVALPRVLDTINQLNTLIGDPLIQSSTFKWLDGSTIDLSRWSLRQVVALSKLARATQGYSLRTLGKFMIGTQPFDTPYSPGATSCSLRTLLTNFSD
jgi:hypothetical protein